MHILERRAITRPSIFAKWVSALYPHAPILLQMTPYVTTNCYCARSPVLFCDIVKCAVRLVAAAFVVRLLKFQIGKLSDFYFSRQNACFYEGGALRYLVVQKNSKLTAIYSSCPIPPLYVYKHTQKGNVCVQGYTFAQRSNVHRPGDVRNWTLGCLCLFCPEVHCVIWCSHFRMVTTETDSWLTPKVLSSSACSLGKVARL